MSMPIYRAPSRAAADALLKAAALPAEDLTDAHMEHFFYIGQSDAPMGLVGVEMFGSDALLRSLAVIEGNRSGGIGSALVTYAEQHARAIGAHSLYLLTTTAEEFFRRRGYSLVARERAPLAIRQCREFADICPASSAFMVKHL